MFKLNLGTLKKISMTSARPKQADFEPDLFDKAAIPALVLAVWLGAFVMPTVLTIRGGVERCHAESGQTVEQCRKEVLAKFAAQIPMF